MSNTYATFGINRSWQQLRFAWDSRRLAQANMTALCRQVREHETLMATRLGRPVEQLRILEIGPGQGLERARYFGLHNEVIGVDLDVVPQGFDPAGYYRLYRKNGFGRLAKTIGRKLLLGPVNARAWAQAVGVAHLPSPQLLHGDICQAAPAENAFDMVMSWSVFEHLPDPERALRNVVRALRPGGIFFISLHLYTSNNGHHDIRAFTGQEHRLPLWAHLRPSTQAEVEPSSDSNRWRLAQWRQLYSTLTPGAQELLVPAEQPDEYRRQLTGALRSELGAYSDEELLTVDLISIWKKPDEASVLAQQSASARVIAGGSLA